MPASVRTAMQEAMEKQGRPAFFSPPEDATPAQLAEFEARIARMLIPDESITTWIDVGDFIDLKWNALRKHVTQMSDEMPFFAAGIDGWREFWSREAYVLRESSVETPKPESDLFAGIA